jgi:hypothetical protein
VVGEDFISAAGDLCRAGRIAFSMALQEVPSVVAIIIGYVQFPADLLSTATL